MATIQKIANSVEDAQADLDEAKDVLSALKDRQLRDGNVKADEFSHAGSAVELAEIALQGAIEAEVAAAAEKRLAELRKIRREVEDSANAFAAAKVFDEVVAAMAKLVSQIGPSRNARLNQAVTAVRALDVPESLNTPPRDIDAGLAWHGPGLIHGGARLSIDGRAVAPVSLAAVFRAAAARACQQEQVHPSAADATGADKALVADAKAYFDRRL